MIWDGWIIFSINALITKNTKIPFLLAQFQLLQTLHSSPTVAMFLMTCSPVKHRKWLDWNMLVINTRLMTGASYILQRGKIKGYARLTIYIRKQNFFLLTPKTLTDICTKFKSYNSIKQTLYLNKKVYTLCRSHFHLSRNIYFSFNMSMHFLVYHKAMLNKLTNFPRCILIF